MGAMGCHTYATARYRYRSWTGCHAELRASQGPRLPAGLVSWQAGAHRGGCGVKVVVFVAWCTIHYVCCRMVIAIKHAWMASLLHNPPCMLYVKVRDASRGLPTSQPPRTHCHRRWTRQRRGRLAPRQRQGRAARLLQPFQGSSHLRPSQPHSTGPPCPCCMGGRTQVGCGLCLFG